MKLAEKIQSSRKTEREYRKLPKLSYSNLKSYDADRSKFYREMILGEKSKEKRSDAMILGDIVHHLLADREYDEKFHISQANKPTGMWGDLCDALVERSLQSMNEYREQQDKFVTIFGDALHRVQYNVRGELVSFKERGKGKGARTIEDVMTEFEGSDSEMYYKDAIENIDKTVVFMSEIEKAEKLVKVTKEDEDLRWLFHPEGNVETFQELPVEFSIGESEYKCLPDRKHVDHDRKVIDIYDFKTDWDNEEGCENSYVRKGYYLQNGLYHYGVSEWAKEHDLADYKVNPLTFIWIDSGGFNRPVITETSQDDIDRAWRGFKVRGVQYTGLKTIIANLNWNIETANWRTSKALHESNLRTKLKVQYGSR